MDATGTVHAIPVVGATYEYEENTGLFLQVINLPVVLPVPGLSIPYLSSYFGPAF